ncbi:hypothetical protein MMYC01_210646 [Madurella mycetomatis]|uniref:Uncharacterized protein n=1 Tax=Madurella mycetomatis TaxID=100816 RepID=A0A175VMV3_9PEZI|nr:hypothetical protein MMYC01_210646 [Madurella mycetomatis]
MKLDPNVKYSILYSDKGSRAVIVPVKTCIGRARAKIKDDDEFLRRVGNKIDRLRHARYKQEELGVIKNGTPRYKEILALRYYIPGGDLNGTIGGLLGELGLSDLSHYRPYITASHKTAYRTIAHPTIVDALTKKIVIDLADLKTKVNEIKNNFITEEDVKAALIEIREAFYKISDKITAAIVVTNDGLKK